MLTVLSPTYTLRLEIQDPVSLQYVENIADKNPRLQKYHDSLNGKSGCDEVLAEVKKALHDRGIVNFYVALEKFEHRPQRYEPVAAQTGTG